MSTTQHPAGGGWRNRTKIALACAVVSATAMLPVACGLPGGDDETATPVPQQVPATPKVDDAAAVKQVFLDFENAGQERDGAKALSLVTASSKTYYENLRKLALSADKATLSKKRLVDQITVLGLRADAGKEVLRSGDLEAMVEVTMESQQATGDGTTAQDLAQATVTVNGDEATITDPAEPTVQFDLARERGAWKVDVRSVMTMLDEILGDLKELSGGSTTAFVEKAIAPQVGGAAKAKKLWKPVGTGSV